MNKIIIDAIYQYGKRKLTIKFPDNPQFTERVKGLDGAMWDATMAMWLVNNHPENLREIFRLFRGIAEIDATAVFNKKQQLGVLTDLQSGERKPSPDRKTKDPVPEPNEKAAGEILKFKYWMRQKRYSENSQKVYCDALRIFFGFFHDKPLNKIDNADIIRFTHEYILKNSYSGTYQNQIINAVKLFYRKNMDHEIIIEDIERPRRVHKLPNILSKQEVKQILSVHRNLKHKAMLSLIYACGLRRSELLFLKPGDIDSQRHLLIVRNAKGNKDRVVPLSEKIILMLRDYYKSYHPTTWLFEGDQAGNRYTETSLQHIFKQALVKARIKKPATLHWLRHSFATHLLESGTDIRYIQEILGHKSTRTTEIYTHVTEKSIQNIKSPFDELNI